MLVASDLLGLPFTPDLTQAGITYILRALPHMIDQMDRMTFDRLRRMVADVAVELAFRRYLNQQEIPYDVRGSTPFTEPDKYDILLGGHRCDIQTLLISNRRLIRALRARPELLLEAPALAPPGQRPADGHRANDLYVFAFLCGLVTASRDDLQKALKAGQPAYLIHIMPKKWMRPQVWQPLLPLQLGSESDEMLTLEINGQSENREYITRAIELPPREHIQVGDRFYALSSIHIHKPTRARIDIHAPGILQPYGIEPYDWGNIWVYGLGITLAGYISIDEFERNSSRIQPGSHAYQYARMNTKSLAVPVSDLQPLPALLKRVKAWEAKKKETIQDLHN